MRKLFLLTAILGLVLAGNAFAGRYCNNVTFKIENTLKVSGEGRSIKVYSLRYKDGGGTWRTENISDRRVDYKHGTTTSNQDLRNSQDKSISVRAKFKYYAVGGTKKYGYYCGSTKTFTCRDDQKNVTLEISSTGSCP